MFDKFDHSLMFSAIVKNDFSRDTGYIHRVTGEIVFICESEGHADAIGWDVADAVSDRAAVEASPDDWIVIPKFDPRVYGEDQELAFCNRFFAERGLPMQMSGF